MPSGETTLALLDREARELHADADRGWNRLLHGNDTTRDDYIHQLFVTYCFESPFEVACSYTPGVAQVINFREQARCGLIVQDLLTPGCIGDTGAAGVSIPRMSQPQPAHEGSFACEATERKEHTSCDTE